MFSSDLRPGLDRMPFSSRCIFDRKEIDLLLLASVRQIHTDSPGPPSKIDKGLGEWGLTVALPRRKRRHDIDCFFWLAAPLIDLRSNPPPMRIRHGLRDAAAIIVVVLSEVFIV